MEKPSLPSTKTISATASFVFDPSCYCSGKLFPSFKPNKPISFLFLSYYLLPFLLSSSFSVTVMLSSIFLYCIISSSQPNHAHQNLNMLTHLKWWEIFKYLSHLKSPFIHHPKLFTFSLSFHRQTFWNNWLHIQYPYSQSTWYWILTTAEWKQL